MPGKSHTQTSESAAAALQMTHSFSMKKILVIFSFKTGKILLEFSKKKKNAAAAAAGMKVFPNMGLLGIDEHEMHKQSGWADDVSSLGEQRNMAISWEKKGSEF